MLKVTKEILPKSKIKIEVDLTHEQMSLYFDKIYAKLAQSVEVKGFRTGKAPKNLIISQIGENRLNSEIIDLALQETYPKAIEQEKIFPIAPPNITIQKVADLIGEKPVFCYIAEIDVMPEVKLGDYRKIKVQKSKIKIKDQKVKKDEIDQVLSHLRREHATFNNINGPCKMGDRVEMDFEGTEKGVVLEEFSSKNYPVILGSKVLLPEFEKEIIGLKTGQEKEFTIGIKNNRDKKAEKRNITFKVKINKVSNVILPELNDEFAQKFGKKNIQELTEAIEKDIEKQKISAQKSEEESQVIEKLLEICHVDVPESLILQETERSVEKIKEKVTMSGMDFNKYLETIKKDEEGLKNDLKPQSERTIKIGLIIGEIAKKEEKNWKIDLKDKDAGKKILEKLVEISKK